MERGMCKLNRLESPLQNIGPDLPYKKMDNLCAKVHIYWEPHPFPYITYIPI